MSDRQGVEINYCPDCRGVWLDRGGLDKIIDRSGGRNTETRSGEGGRDYNKQDSYRESESRHKKSFLSGLFD